MYLNSSIEGKCLKKSDMVKVRIKRNKKGVSPLVKKGTSQQTIGMGYIIIPEDVDREQFVSSCFRKRRVSIIDDADGNLIHECYITREALENIEFPENSGEKGVPIVWVSQPFLQIPMVIGTFTEIDKIPMRKDKEIHINKSYKDGSINIDGNPEKGTLFINVSSKKISKLKISSSGNEDSLIEVKSSGTVKVESDKSIEAISYQTIDVKVIDPITENESGIKSSKEETMLYSIYGEGDEKDFSKTTINKDGFVTETKIGDVSYSHTVNNKMSELKYQDCSIKSEEKAITISQGENSLLEIKDGKIALVNGSTGLNDVLKSIVDAIKTLTVSTGVGPSGTPLPPTIQKTTQIESSLKNLFNK